MKKTLGILFAAVTAASSTITYGAAVANDNASNAAYNGGRIDDGDNGGTGFGAWDVTPNTNGGSNGNFEGSSTGTPGIGSDAWGFYANSGATSDAIRPFTAGGYNGLSTLAANETFSLKIDINSINTGGPVVGFGLQNSSGTNRFEMYFKGGASNWNVNIGGTEYATSIPYDSDGFSIAFTQLSSNSWSLSATRLDTNTTFTVTSGATQVLAASDISRVRLFNFNAGGGGAFDQYFNDLAIVPEPTTGLLMGAATAFGSFFLARRRRR